VSSQGLESIAPLNRGKTQGNTSTRAKGADLNLGGQVPPQGKKRMEKVMWMKHTDSVSKEKNEKQTGKKGMTRALRRTE
jgi:hypothetical protein